MSEEKVESFFGGFLVGAFVGFVIGLLYAPQSGEETRKLIKQKGIEVTEKAKEKGEELKEVVKSKVEEVKEKGKEVLKKKGVEIQEEETK